MLKKYFLQLLVVFGLLVSVACEKEKEEATPTPTPEPVPEVEKLGPDTPCEFSATIDGKDYFWSEEEGFKAGTNSNKAPGLDTIFYVPKSTLSSTVGSRYVGFSKGIIYTLTETLDKDSIRDFFAKGSYSYSIYAEDGIDIGFTDFSEGDNNYWTTSLGHQGENTFQITEMTGTETSDGYIITIKSEFSCYFFNDVGDSLIVENGKYTGCFSVD